MRLWTDIVCEAKANNKDYKFYVLNKKGDRIRTGWEYKEDAIDDRKEDTSVAGRIVAKSTLKSLGIDPDDNKFLASRLGGIC